jgi:hypothetical protein
MQAFIESNPGLRSRFNKYVDFPDYSPEELTHIFENLAAKNRYVRLRSRYSVRRIESLPL